MSQFAQRQVGFQVSNAGKLATVLEFLIQNETFSFKQEQLCKICQSFYMVPGTGIADLYLNQPTEKHPEIIRTGTGTVLFGKYSE